VDISKAREWQRIHNPDGTGVQESEGLLETWSAKKLVAWDCITGACDWLRRK